MCILHEIGIDQSYNPSAQGLVLLKAARIEDLEPGFKLRVADENGRILLVTVAWAVQKLALLTVGVFYREICMASSH